MLFYKKFNNRLTQVQKNSITNISNIRMTIGHCSICIYSVHKLISGIFLSNRNQLNSDL